MPSVSIASSVNFAKASSQSSEYLNLNMSAEVNYIVVVRRVECEVSIHQSHPVLELMLDIIEQVTDVLQAPRR